MAFKTKKKCTYWHLKKIHAICYSLNQKKVCTTIFDKANNIQNWH